MCLMLTAEDYNSCNWNYTSKSATKLSPHQINNTAGVALSLAVFCLPSMDLCASVFGGMSYSKQFTEKNLITSSKTFPI